MPKHKYYAHKAIRGDDDIIICAGDVETEGLGGQLLSVQFGMFGEVRIETGEDMVAKFFETFLEYTYPCVWFFHFGQYDWRYFLEYLENENLDVEIRMRTDTDIYEIRAKRKQKRNWSVLRDSGALFAHSLKELAETFCPEKPKLEIDVAHFDPQNPQHIAYAKRDVEILLTALPRLFSLIHAHFGINPTATAAGTAVKAWQKSLPKDVIYNGSDYSEVEAFIRQGYYGGLVFLTTTRSFENCKTFDINSSYPAAMLEFGVPCGQPIYTTKFHDELTGFYSVTVKCPDDIIIPILPCRNQRGHMQWRSGTFQTVVSSQELLFAVEHGYDILDIKEGYIFGSIEFPFKDFIENCKAIRREFKGKPNEIVAKLLQNSLYGKFGSRRERMRLVHHDDKDFEKYEGLIAIDESGYWYGMKDFDDEMLCLPQWAAFITANARLRLLRAAYALGPENCLYGDTDSLTVKASADVSRISVGQEYGQFKLEKTWRAFRAIAPKVYSGVLADGTWRGAAKGLPRKHLTDGHWRKIFEDGVTTAQVESVASLRVAIRQGVHPAKPLQRVSSSIKNSQNYNLLSNGDVRVKIAV